MSTAGPPERRTPPARTEGDQRNDQAGGEISTDDTAAQLRERWLAPPWSPMLPRADVDGTFLTGDLKTSAKLNDGNYPLPVAAQLAGYSRGCRNSPVNRWLKTAPVEKQVGWLLSVPIGSPERAEGNAPGLDQVDLAVGWEAVQLGIKVREFAS